VSGEFFGFHHELGHFFVFARTFTSFYFLCSCGVVLPKPPFDALGAGWRIYRGFVCLVGMFHMVCVLRWCLLMVRCFLLEVSDALDFEK